MRRGTAPGLGQTSFRFEQERRSERLSPRLTALEKIEAQTESAGPMPPNRSACRSMGLGWRNPCPHFGCRYHLGAERYADHVTLFWPDRALDEYDATCWLAVAEHGPRTEPQIARITGLSLRSVERATASAFAKIAREHPELAVALRELSTDSPQGPWDLCGDSED